MIGHIVYLVFVNQKMGYPVDRVSASGDLNILQKDGIASWMDFHTLYFFTFEDFTDVSEFVNKIHVK